MWPFRRAQTPPDDDRQHRVTLDLIEQLAALRGQVRAMELEWADIRVQIRKAYERMEKAAERLEKKRQAKVVEGWDDDEPLVDDDKVVTTTELMGFAKKLRDFKGAG